MLETAALGFLAVLMLGVPDGRLRYPQETFRKVWMCLAGLGLLALYSAAEPVIPVSYGTAAALAACAAVFLLAADTADRPEIAAWLALPWVIGVALGLLVFAQVPAVTLFRVLLACGLFHAGVVLVENVLRIRVFQHVPWHKQFGPRGIIGNPGGSGAYLLPHLFLAPWLALNDSPWWWLSLVPLLAAFYRTRCRSALVGGVIGAWVVWVLHEPLALGLVFAGGLLVLFNPHTLKERVAYWTVAWRQIRRAPLFGCGPDHWKIHVPELQAEIDQERGGEFLKKENYQDPWPRHAHSVPLQLLLDVGLLGLASVCWLLFRALHEAPAEPLLFAALAAMAAAGMLWHAHAYVPVNVVFWAIVGQLAATTPGTAVSPWVLAAFLAAAGVLSVCYVLPWLRWARAEWQATDARAREDNAAEREHLSRALRVFPRSTLTNLEAALWAHRNRNRGLAYVHAAMCFYHYDGDVPKWTVYVNLGNTLRDNGALHLADSAYNDAQKRFPRWRLPAVLKAQLGKMVIRMEMRP